MDIGTLVLNEEKYVAAANCGNEGARRSIELLKKNEKVGEVMPLYLCSDIMPWKMGARVLLNVSEGY
jgi:hypothetical protein